MGSRSNITYIFVIALVLFYVNNSDADSLQVGVSTNSELAYSELVRLSAILGRRRTKNVFYSDERNRNIKALSAVDLDASDGKATITAGGVGLSYANVRLRSARGERLNYQVQMFV